MSVVQSQAPIPLIFTDSAANKVKQLVEEEGNPALKLRVYVTGGGCSGFQYGFSFDEEHADDVLERFKDTECSIIGQVIDEDSFVIEKEEETLIDVNLKDIQDIWCNSLRDKLSQ